MDIQSIKYTNSYNEIVINPMSLSMILGHNISDQISWINLELD